MGDVLQRATQFLRKSEPPIEMLGYRLVQNGHPAKTRTWHDLDLAIDAAKFRAAESVGALANIPSELIPMGVDIVSFHTVTVGIEKIEKCGDAYHYTGAALVTYTLGTCLPQVKMLSQPVIPIHA